MRAYKTILVALSIFMLVPSIKADENYWQFLKQLLIEEQTPEVEVQFDEYIDSLSAEQLLTAARQCAEEIQQNEPEDWEEASMALGFFYQYYPRKTDNLRSIQPLLDDLQNKSQNVCWRYCIMHLLDAWHRELGMQQSLDSANIMRAILIDTSEPRILRVKAARESGELYRKVHSNNLRLDPEIKRLVKSGRKYDDVLRDAQRGRVKLSAETIERNKPIEAALPESIQAQIDIFNEPDLPVYIGRRLIGSLVKLRIYDNSGQIKQAMNRALRNYKNYKEELWFYLARTNIVYFENQEEAESILQQMIDEAKNEHEKEVNLIRLRKKLDKGEVKKESL